MTDLRERLRSIRTFPSLVKFLRDELDWPLDSTEDFEDLTFDYTPEELGIDAASAAKIEEIKRLRPLSHYQPWSIFFVKFEPKQLPVVALRRILNRVVVKKRVTGSAAEQQKWATDDLLFISAYGDEEERRISFAHFSQNVTGEGPPTLKVLAWDERDTGLHLDDVAHRLVEHLSWPDEADEWDDETWRERWGSAFDLRHREVVTTSKALALQLATLARAVRARINAVLEIESEDGPITGLMSAFREALVHDLEPDDFADMYAQTIAYGLLSARIANPTGESAEHLPVTNPFVKELMEAFLHVGNRDRGEVDGIDFDELGVSEVMGLLDDANMEAVVRDFGDENPLEDPVIHFYELFLKEYDAKQRMQRGVFYTPRPVVSYIIRSVHELLRTEFGLKDGLADTATWGEVADRVGAQIPDGVGRGERFVTILDPATGTGTFLVEAIDVIHRTLIEKWTNEARSGDEIRDLWNEFVPTQLLPRLFGFELMMAPYAIAHLKIGLKLFETGYRFASDARVRIYLTNALEPAHDFSSRLDFAVPALAHEAASVNSVKLQNRFTVVVGNPPYSKISSNQSAWIESLMEDFKLTVRSSETQIQSLSDDYAKFFRLGAFKVSQATLGILSFISNNNFLDGPIFRDMRHHLCSVGDAIYLVNLHGDSRKREKAPNGTADENVFAIQQGVGISLISHKGDFPDVCTIRYADLWGSRHDKYGALIRAEPELMPWALLEPAEPDWYFVPRSEVGSHDWDAYWHLYDVFGSGARASDQHVRYGAGFVTSHDEFAIATNVDELAERISWFVEHAQSEEIARARFRLCRTEQWSFARARRELPGIDVREAARQCLYRPFDHRVTVFDRNVCTIVRRRIQDQFEFPNVALLTTRRATRLPWSHAFVTRHAAEFKSACHDRNTIVFPLRWVPVDSQQEELELADTVWNISPSFVRRMETAIGDGERARNSSEPLEHQFFGYIYAVLYSPTYRTRYGERLTEDFPRIPIPMSGELFRELAGLGHELVAQHTLESSASELSAPWLQGTETRVASGYPRFSEERVAINADAWFAPVRRAVWEFEIGGYQVCHKWLKDRKGGILSAASIEQYRRIVAAIRETIRLMAKIDEVIEERGGWPDAFATSGGGDG